MGDIIMLIIPITIIIIIIIILIIIIIIFILERPLGQGSSRRVQPRRGQWARVLLVPGEALRPGFSLSVSQGSLRDWVCERMRVTGGGDWLFLSVISSRRGPRIQIEFR